MLAHSSWRTAIAAWPFQGARLAAVQQNKTSASHERQVEALVKRMRDLVMAPPALSERFHVVFLDPNKRVLGEFGCGEGCQASLSIDLRELFWQALSIEASQMILAHNHPSGDCRPSQSDVNATERIAGLAQALDIELLDHLIFSKNAVYSMRLRGLL